MEKKATVHVRPVEVAATLAVALRHDPLAIMRHGADVPLFERIHTTDAVWRSVVPGTDGPAYVELTTENGQRFRLLVTEENAR